MVTPPPNAAVRARDLSGGAAPQQPLWAAATRAETAAAGWPARLAPWRRREAGQHPRPPGWARTETSAAAGQPGNEAPPTRVPPTPGTRTSCPPGRPAGPGPPQT